MIYAFSFSLSLKNKLQRGSIDSYVGCELLSHEETEENLKHAEYTPTNSTLFYVKTSYGEVICNKLFSF